MRSDHYVHPEFGLLSPRPRLRRELRMVFFSVLFGIAIGAAAVIALSVNKTSDDAQVPGPSSASVLSEKPAEAILNNGVKEGHINESDGIKVQVGSETHKDNPATTCAGATSSCDTASTPASNLRAMRKPAANEALAIGRAPLGRPGAPVEMPSVGPSESTERALEKPSGVRSEELAADLGSANHLVDKTPPKNSRRQPRERAAHYRNDRGISPTGRGYHGPAGELDRAYALDRSRGPKGFWEWSR
jgi:hypothetical protein